MYPFRNTRRAAAPAVAAAALLVLAGCAPSEPDGETGSAAPTGFAAEHYTTPLADVCPATIVLQNNWWPQPDLGWAYQLIGDGGTIDADTFRYSGPLGSTGVNLEIRSGGPATGWTLPPQQLFLDDEILLGVTTTEDSISNYLERPITSVFTYNVKSPTALIWGTDDWKFDSLADVRDSGETVLAFDGAPFVDYLIGKGLLNADQIDGSYDGDLSRFVAEDGHILTQGFVTSEVYKLQNEIAAWAGKPVHYLLVGDEYTSYNSQISIRSDRLDENAACLEKLVPLFQQATVDFAADPAATNKTLLDIVAGFTGSGWELSEGEVEWSTKTAVKEGIIGNSPDGTLGSFDLDRVDDFIASYLPILEARGDAVEKDLTAEDIVTNRFIDPSISR